jgi:predicted enzyme related to lactoylglutathione lyase
MSPKTKKVTKNAAAWFEIPAEDIGRAKKFYEQIFDIEMIDMDFGEELKMTMFPVEEGGVGGALCQHKDFYRPGYEGPLVYFSANPDLQPVLDRVETNGGKILQPKQQITEEYGCMAIFEDSEGNRVALHSDH